MSGGEILAYVTIISLLIVGVALVLDNRPAS
jgi:hypothetical protein